MSTPQPPVLVRTKLHPARPRPGTVARPDLVARLRDGARGRVTLLRAVAGSGKTTLLAEWLAGEEAVAWVSLDAGDNDPVRFWSYVLEALRSAGLPVARELTAALAAPGTRARDVVLPGLLNDLAAAAGQRVLVLDDLHLVDSAEVHEDLGFLVERMPPTLHVCVATRSEPPAALAIPRLRARGELTELRAEDLRLDLDQAQRLLESAAGEAPPREALERLHERTEGWAAGLYLSALSLRGRSEPEDLAAGVGGDDEHLADYLTAEILAGLDPDTRGFLLRTSVLDRLCGPLCDRVLGREGASSVLEEMERSNLLVVPLDRRRLWFRYHHLFADLLRRQLDLEVPAAEVRALHCRASDWWEAHDELPEAVRHALAAQDAERVAALVGRHWNAYLQQGQLATVRGWLDRLEDRPELHIARAWVELDSGETAAAARAADAAGPAEPRSPMVHATVRYMAGDLAAAAEPARRALELADPASPWVAVAQATLGSALLWLGSPTAEVEAALEDAIARAVPRENMIAVLRAHAALGLLRLDAGDRDAARRALDAALEVRDGHGLTEYSWAALSVALEGRLLEDAGDLAAAESAFARAAELAARGRVFPERAYALVRLARVRQARQAPDAQDALREARRVLAACPDPGVLAHALSAAERGGSAAASESPGGDELTERELAVLRMLASSLTQSELASSLYVSVNTLKTHVRTIYRKLGVASREEAVMRARERDLL